MKNHERLSEYLPSLPKYAEAAALLGVSAVLASGSVSVDDASARSSLLKQIVPTMTGEPRYLGSAVSVRYMDLPDYSRSFTSNYDSLTPENELKMEVTQPKPGAYNFASADQLVNFALLAGKRVRGHALIFPAQDPYYIKKYTQTCKDGINDAYERNEMIHILNEHITVEMNHFKTRIHEWDVVNEAVDTNNAWQKCIGPEYIDMAFRRAHQVDPTARLYINEYNAELPEINGQPNPRNQAYKNLVDGLLDRNVPIDGVGLQTHVTTDFAGDMKPFAETINHFIDKGLTVELTEVDVSLPPGSKEPRLFDRQTATYRSIAKVCGRRPQCVGMTVWGVNDHVSWLSDNSPLPIDASGKPKRALREIRKWLTPLKYRKKR